MEIEDRTQQAHPQAKCNNAKCMGCAILTGLTNGTYSYKTDSFMRAILTALLKAGGKELLRIRAQKNGVFEK